MCVRGREGGGRKKDGLWCICQVRVASLLSKVDQFISYSRLCGSSGEGKKEEREFAVMHLSYYGWELVIEADGLILFVC